MKVLSTVFLICLASMVSVISCSKEQATQPTPVVETPKLRPLHTEGRWIMNDLGDKVILRGVNIPSLEWNARGENVAASVVYMADVWKANLVRIPLSQDRWYGHAPEQNDGGKGYRAIVDQMVKTGDSKNCYVWLELHWNNAGEWGKNIGQHKMPDDLSQVFWQELAALYANHPAVLFGLYNEPHDISWEIWRNGGMVEETIAGAPISYRTPGHQKLLDVVRASGANNIVVASGLDWGFDLRGIAAGYALTGDNIAYDTHPYPWKPKPWDIYFGNVGKQLPIIVGEWGGTVEEGHQQYGIDLAGYLRRNAFCWTAWCLHPSAGPQLIRNWDYQPTWFGELVMRELGAPVTPPQ